MWDTEQMCAMKEELQSVRNTMFGDVSSVGADFCWNTRQSHRSILSKADTKASSVRTEPQQYCFREDATIPSDTPAWARLMIHEVRALRQDCARKRRPSVASNESTSTYKELPSFPSMSQQCTDERGNGPSENGPRLQPSEHNTTTERCSEWRRKQQTDSLQEARSEAKAVFADIVGHASRCVRSQHESDYLIKRALTPIAEPRLELAPPPTSVGSASSASRNFEHWISGYTAGQKQVAGGDHGAEDAMGLDARHNSDMSLDQSDVVTASYPFERFPSGCRSNTPT